MRPIDADAITYCSYDLDNYHWFRAVDEDEIAEMPTLTLDDLRPKGRWERDENGKVRCSVCKKKTLEAKEGVWYTSSFCHNCGADMRGGGEDG
jgi:hypothetical protein